MNEYLSADRPVFSSTEDRFQRYTFSKRIAETIINRKNEDCIVLGIYGAWGEGKTSVINFILSELQQNNDILTIKFNPWRYKDEDDLLKQFFNSLSGVLNKGLKSNKEKLGDFLSRYAKCLNIDIPVIGNIGGAVEGIGHVMSEVDVDELKKRIGTCLKDNQQKVVVFIDDIDRLEKAEIHAIFRLVKLTADFPNTVYVLSFDERMVAAAIGERFGEGDKIAGENFLQKIVQVPLKLPHAQIESLRDYCIGQIDQALDSNFIKLSETDKLRLAKDFPVALLPAINTPRLAVRLANSIAFALPLLRGEVNIVDLIFIEGIKVLYSESYDAIKQNPDLFVKSFYDGIADGPDNRKVKELTKLIETLLQPLSRLQAHGLKVLLKELFPNAALTTINAKVEFEGFEDKNKRLADVNYFNRYFTYTLRPGEISDVSFHHWLQLSENGSEDAVIISEMKKIIEFSSVDKFLYKLRLQEDNLSLNAAATLTKSLAKVGDYFYTSGLHLTHNWLSEPRGQLGIFIGSIMARFSDKHNHLTIAEDLLLVANPFSFSLDLFRQFALITKDSSKVFDIETINKFSGILVERGRIESGDQMLWEAFPEVGSTIVHHWFNIEPDQVNSYITEWIGQTCTSE